MARVSCWSAAPLAKLARWFALFAVVLLALRLVIYVSDSPLHRLSLSAAVDSVFTPANTNHNSSSNFSPHTNFSKVAAKDQVWRVPTSFLQPIRKQPNSTQCRKLTPATDMDVSFLTCKEQDMLPGLKQMMHVIYAHQHPPSCKDKQFVILYDWPWGLGSLMAVTTRQAKVALALDRIFLLAESVPNGFIYHNSSANAFYDAAYCKGQRFWPCYFQPVTNCTLTAEDISQAADISHYLNKSSLSHVRTVADALALQQNVSMPRVVRMYPQAMGLHGLKPAKIQTWMDSCLPPHSLRLYDVFMKIYLMRWNSRTWSELSKRQREIFKDQEISPGMINLHVRRGDKAGEMSLASDADFLKAVEVLRRAGNYTGVFVSTEDEGFIVNATPRLHPSLEVLFTEVPRYSAGKQSPMEHSKKLGPAVETTNNWVNLHLAASCDGFIGQRGSNWVQLIDDFRSTMYCKRNRPFVDLAVGDALLLGEHKGVDSRWFVNSH